MSKASELPSERPSELPSERIPGWEQLLNNNNNINGSRLQLFFKFYNYGI